MNILKKIKDMLTKHKHKRQTDCMWEIKEKDTGKKDLFEVFSKNIIWAQNGKNPAVPYYYVVEDGKKHIKLPYVELDVGLYIRNKAIIINKFMEVKN